MKKATLAGLVFLSILVIQVTSEIHLCGTDLVGAIVRNCMRAMRHYRNLDPFSGERHTSGGSQTKRGIDKLLLQERQEKEDRAFNIMKKCCRRGCLKQELLEFCPKYAFTKYVVVLQ